jgi:chemotaxis protein MotB
MESRRHKNAGTGQDTSAWMVTFSDLIMLLLTFFVLILTMSSMDQKKLKEIFRHLQEAVGVLEFSGFGEVSPPSALPKQLRDPEAKIIMDRSLLANLFTASSEVEKKIKEALEEITRVAEMTEDERGIVFTFRENLLFHPGEVGIRPEVEPFLNRLAETMDMCRNPILITGHSCDTPLRSRVYESNWDLSLYRGLSVLSYFTERRHLPMHRFMVSAAGSSRPVASNSSPEGRARNRRVEIIFRHVEDF